jgi:hypothetical protein
MTNYEWGTLDNEFYGAVGGGSSFAGNSHQPVIPDIVDLCVFYDGVHIRGAVNCPHTAQDSIGWTAQTEAINLRERELERQLRNLRGETNG